jgi:hypothetical protein
MADDELSDREREAINEAFEGSATDSRPGSGLRDVAGRVASGVGDVAEGAKKTVSRAREKEESDTDAENKRDTPSIEDVPGVAAAVAERVSQTADTVDETVGELTGQGTQNQREAKAERVAQRAQETAQPRQADISELPAGVRGAAQAAIKSSQRGVAQSARRGRLKSRQTTNQRGTGALGAVGLGGVVRGAREQVEQGTTVNIDKVRVPGTAAQVPIPEQEIELSGRGLRSATQDAREATGFPAPLKDEFEETVNRPLQEKTAVVDKTAADIQQDFIESRQEFQEENPEIASRRSVFSYAPVSPTPITAAFSTGAAATGGGGATAGGTGAAGGGGAGAGATGSAAQTELLKALGLASAGAAVQQARVDEEPGVGSELETPETTEVGQAEIDVSEDTTVTPQDLQLPADAFDNAAGELQVPDDVTFRDGELQVPEQVDELVLRAQQGQQQQQEDEDEESDSEEKEDEEEDGDEQRREVLVPEEMIPDEEVTLGEESVDAGETDEAEGDETDLEDPLEGVGEVTDDTFADPQDTTADELFPEQQVNQEPEIQVEEQARPLETETEAEGVGTRGGPRLDRGLFLSERERDQQNTDSLFDEAAATTPTLDTAQTAGLDLDAEAAAVGDLQLDADLTAPDLQLDMDAMLDQAQVEQPAFAEPTAPAFEAPPAGTAFDFGEPTIAEESFGPPGGTTPSLFSRRPELPDPDDEEAIRLFDEKAVDKLFESGIASAEELFGGDDLLPDDAGGLFDNSSDTDLFTT